MLSNTHLHEELEKIIKVMTDDKDLNVYQKTMIMIGTLVLKLVHNIRTNQTMMMEKMGVEKIKPRTSRDESDEKKG